MNAVHFLERLKELKNEYGDLNLIDYLDYYVVDLVYYYEIWDKGTRYEEKFEYLRIETNEKKIKKQPLKSSEIIKLLNKLIKKYGNLMIIFYDKEPVCDIKYAPDYNYFYLTEI